MSETFVDATSRGVEIGRRLLLSEIGPTCAYLEHPVPMPVGSELTIKTDEDLSFLVAVVRVCEQVTGSERAPGMFVRVVDRSSAAESWWNERKTSDDDPAFPEPARMLPIRERPTMRLDPAEIAAVTHEGLQRPAALHASEEEVVDSGDGDGDGDGSNGAGSTLQGISVAAALAAAQQSSPVPNVRNTMRMTPEQIKQITDTADDPAADVKAEADGDDNGDDNGDDKKATGKKKKRRRKKRKTST